MSYKCEILADSLSPQGHRLTTFKITYPRIIHAEMCRHRILSRNTASSRAIPFEKMVRDVIENPFVPLAFQKQHSGMQGGEYLDSDKKYTFKEIQISLHEALKKAFCDSESGKWEDSWIPTDEIMNRYVNPILSVEVDGLTCSEWWLKVRDLVVGCAYILSSFSVTKQLCNRLLEPFVWTTELVSGTEWENFFELRCPRYYFEPENLYFKSRKDFGGKYHECFDSDEFVNWTEEQWLGINQSQAEIHIQKIAEMMWDEINLSKPKMLQAGEFHLPYGDKFDNGQFTQYLIKKWQNQQAPTEGNLQERIKISVARCARISYTTLGDNPKIDYKADSKLHDRLLESKHLSCFEHCSRVMSEEEYESFYKGEGANKAHTGLDKNKGWCNNYRGFIQYRYLIENQ